MSVILDKREFTLGVVLLAVFAIPLILLATPVFNGKTGMVAADALFNSLAKESSYYIPQARDKAKKMEGEQVDIAITAEDAEHSNMLVTMLRNSGAEVVLEGNELSVQGDLGEIMAAAAVDADNLFRQQGTKIENRYNTDNPKFVLYLWQEFFSQAQETYLQEKMPDKALSCHTLMYRAIEPAYNFAGIEAATISERMGRTIFLLVFYLIYTVWFGFGILFVFESLGIKAQSH